MNHSWRIGWVRHGIDGEDRRPQPCASKLAIGKAWYTGKIYPKLAVRLVYVIVISHFKFATGSFCFTIRRPSRILARTGDTL